MNMDQQCMKQQQQHFLIVTYPVQGHINPGLHLANRLALATSSLVTFSTATSAHRRMFPHATLAEQSEIYDGNLTFLPYPDDSDTKSFSSFLNDLTACGRHVTCLIHTLLLTWAADAARQLSIPCVQYWIQPATTFISYYHYFKGYRSLIDSHKNDPLFSLQLPGLPPMRIRDLPSFLLDATSDQPYYNIFLMFNESFDRLDKDEAQSRPKILVNTFNELEPNALRAVDGLDLIAIGPILPAAFGKNRPSSSFDIFKSDEKQYMKWLDTKPQKSVVYVSFGSLSVTKKQQMEEILKGLKAGKRPYLWVVRKDSRYEGFELEEDEEDGMIVEWCSQVSVLSHSSVGCFVTHCGWNSSMESLVCGVPIVGVPQWADQGTNVMLMEKELGIGVRGEVNEEGVLESGELMRCLDLVLGDGERREEIRRKAEGWKEKAWEAIREGGTADRNLRAFVEELAKYD